MLFDIMSISLKKSKGLFTVVGDFVIQMHSPLAALIIIAGLSKGFLLIYFLGFLVIYLKFIVDNCLFSKKKKNTVLQKETVLRVPHYISFKDVTLNQMRNLGNKSAHIFLMTISHCCLLWPNVVFSLIFLLVFLLFPLLCLSLCAATALQLVMHGSRDGKEWTKVVYVSGTHCYTVTLLFLMVSFSSKVGRCMDSDIYT